MSIYYDVQTYNILDYQRNVVLSWVHTVLNKTVFTNTSRQRKYFNTNESKIL